MKEQFQASQINKVIDQALIYQCACPAQVCKTIFELRELYEYQMNCANDTTNDKHVHETIAQATDQAHQIMEACLTKILEIEGWDMAQLAMPENLKKKSVKTI